MDSFRFIRLAVQSKCLVLLSQVLGSIVRQNEDDARVQTVEVVRAMTKQVRGLFLKRNTMRWVVINATSTITL